MSNSKSTGIIRRIDDLGRVVIPKEIRRQLRIREGDPLEIYAAEDSVTFKKYSVLGKLANCGDILRGLHRLFKCPVLLCDRDEVVDACGIPKEQYENRPFTEEFSHLAPRALIIADSAIPTPVLMDSELYADIVLPIWASGELYGSIVMLKKASGEPSDAPREFRMACMDLAALTITSMIEAD